MARGRKEGSSSGKREIFWVCIGLDSGKIIAEKIYSSKSTSEDDIKNFTKEKASDIFENLYSVKTSEVIGPCYDVKSLSKPEIVSKSLKNKELTINNSNTTISSVLGLGHYNGWSGTVFSILGKKDEVLFIASERIDSNQNMILPPASPIKKELISFV